MNDDLGSGVLGLLPGLMLARNDLIERVRTIEHKFGLHDSLANLVQNGKQQQIPSEPPTKTSSGAYLTVDSAEAKRLREHGLSWRRIGTMLGVSEYVAKHAVDSVKGEKPTPPRRLSEEGEQRRMAGYLAYLKRKGFKPKTKANGVDHSLERKNPGWWSNHFEAAKQSGAQTALQYFQYVSAHLGPSEHITKKASDSALNRWRRS